MSCPLSSSAEQPNPTSPSTTPSYEPVGIFWDYENCAPSTNSSGYNIVDNIRALANQYGAVNVFKAYLQLPDKSSAKQSSLRSELQSCGLSLTDCPHNGKNTVDLMMIVDIMAFIKDNSPPATIILISGDRDFAYLLSTIRWRKYNVVLISNTFMTHESLTAQASVVYDWKSDILKARPPSKLPPLRPRRETLPSVGSPSAPQELDNSLGSDVRAAGPPNKRTTPAIDPPALPPRPGSIATAKTIRPLHTALPQDAPLTKSEVVPIPPKAEVPTEAAPGGIPMAPTSDDRIVADLINESTVVQPSPNAVNPVDEGGFYSPVSSFSEIISSEGNIPSSDPPVDPSTSTSTANTPSARTANTPSPFVPLIDFLKSKRSTNAQPVPFSDIFSHFISTLGYPDMVSLCTSVSGVSTFSQYIDAAIAFGLISLISGTTASRDALLTLRDTEPSLSAKPQFPVPVNTRTPQYGPFESLIRTLTKLWYEGKREPAFSEIHPILLAQDTMAYGRVGAETIEDYVTKAAAENLVIHDSLATFGVFSMAATVRLREPPQLPDDPLPPAQPNVSTRPLPSFPSKEIAVSPPPANVTPHPFQDLIAVLTTLGESMGESESRFSTVASLLLTRRPDAYASAGVTNFADYIALAMGNGVVRIRWVGHRDGWVSLVTQGLKDWNRR